MEPLNPDDPLFSQLRGLEPIFHRSAPNSGREIFESLTDPGFFEVGASGARYDRDTVLPIVTARYAAGEEPRDSAWDVSEFEAHAIGDATFVVTYFLTHDGRGSRRMTLWRMRDGQWTALYHQGTLAERG